MVSPQGDSDWLTSGVQMTALFTRASLIVLAAAALAACADVKPEYPASVAQTPTAPPVAQPTPEPETPVSDEAPRAVPTTPVSTQALPPVNRRPGAQPDTDDIEAAPTPAAQPPAYVPPPPSATYAPPPALPPSAPKRVKREPPPEPAYILSVKGPVRAAKDKTRTVKVAEGDTVNNLSARFLTPKADLIKLNKLKKPFELEVGRELKVPTPKAYIVESGDTLFAISRRFNLPADVLAELNNFDPNEKVRSGEEIALPDAVKDSGPLKRPAPPTARRVEEEQAPVAEQPTRRSPEYQHSQPDYPRPQPPIRPEPPSRYTPAAPAPLVESSPAPTDAQVTAAGQGRFAWPVSGQILSGFGAKPGGQRNDGVDIGAPAGTEVKAAAAGDVVYAGNQVPGFGNLVLIKHPGGWVTAYAHLSTTSVKIKDHVEQGDEVGAVGQTGGAEVPELHFEIRYAPTPRDKAKPIDPSLVLPSGQ
jgi:murein DD-endopeptidase MepM/ murein hydrolase activator NlpD